MQVCFRELFLGSFAGFDTPEVELFGVTFQTGSCRADGSFMTARPQDKVLPDRVHFLIHRGPEAEQKCVQCLQGRLRLQTWAAQLKGDADPQAWASLSSAQPAWTLILEFNWWSITH